MNWRTEDQIYERFMDGASVEAIVGQDFPPIDEMVPSDMPYTREGTLAAWHRNVEQAIRNAIRRRERSNAKELYVHSRRRRWLKAFRFAMVVLMRERGTTAPRSWSLWNSEPHAQRLNARLNRRLSLLPPPRPPQQQGGTEEVPRGR